MFDIFNMLKKEENAAPKQVTRDTIIGDILDMDQSTAPYFMEIGMHCLGCPASRGESIEEADGGAGCFGPVPQGHRGRPAPRPAVQSPADAGTCQLSRPR